MFLPKEQAQHISSVAHEGKVLVFCVDGQGRIYYNVKQGGFEDSYRKIKQLGWEDWVDLAFLQEKDDQSVVEKQARELTYAGGKNGRAWIMRSLYRTGDQSAVAPLQIVSALGHVYVFRQSCSGNLLVDRFVLDWMSNRLNRKLDVDFELTAQATVYCIQTMTKTESQSRALALNVDLSGVESIGVTNYNDRPLVPGEKVGRYRFMSFYLEGDTRHFDEFFTHVVDSEWLLSNSEQARALRQVDLSKPNKTWRVLHRVTYVERKFIFNSCQGVAPQGGALA